MLGNLFEQAAPSVGNAGADHDGLMSLKPDRAGRVNQLEAVIH